jgi:hypothetical protein
MKQPRTLRSVFELGLIWGILWASLTILAGTILGRLDPNQIDAGEEPLVLAPFIGLVGLLCGVVFGGLMSTVERGKPIADLSLVRVAVWGILVCAALPLVAGKGLPEMLVTIPLGAASALTSVAILRKWPALPLAR